MPSADDFLEMFKKLNEESNDQDEEPDLGHENDNSSLNKSITENEISKCIKN